MTDTTTESLVRRWYRVMLRCYRKAYRAEVGRELEETFLDRYRAARRRGRLAVLGFLPRAGWDAVVNGTYERVEHRRTRGTVDAPTSHRIIYWQDVKHALRQLAKSPGFTVLTVVVLSGGLGLSIFTYSFLHTAMLKPLPVDDGASVVRLLVKRNGSTGPLDAAEFAAMRPGITSLTDLGAYTTRQAVVGRGEGSRTLFALATEWNIFETTRTQPLLGRALRPADGAAGAEPVIVLSHWAWRAMYGSDPDVVGRLIDVNAVRTLVIGVMPEGYGFPVSERAWMPIRPELLSPSAPGSTYLDVYGRLRPGHTADQATAELNVLFDQIRDQREEPADSAGGGLERVVVRSYPMAQMGEEGPLVFGVLNVLAGLILLLACINVTNLLLARANERIRETAIRLALGAPRARLVMQSMWESVLLCLAGGVLATWGAAWGLDRINVWSQLNLEGNLAFWWVWGMDRNTLIGAGVFVTLALAVLGGVVSVRAARTEFNAVLHDGTAGSGGRRAGRLARLLVITQVVTVSILMFVGGMSAIIAHRVMHIDLGGYDPTNLLTAAIDLPPDGYEGPEARLALYQDVHDRLTQQGEIAEVVLRARVAELTDAGGVYTAESGGGGGDETGVHAAVARAYVRAIEGPMTTMGLQLLEGRDFNRGDVGAGVPVVIVSESVARREWPTRSGLGERIRVGVEPEWRTVVGVMSDAFLGNPLTKDRSPMVLYLPLAQTDVPEAAVSFKHMGNRDAATGALHRVLADVDPLVVSPQVQSIEEILAKSGLLARSTTKLFLSCFAFALVLAVSGIYGLMARSISQRTREIGVRRALGATDAGIVRLLLGQGGRQLGIGAVIALPVTLLIGIAFSRFLLVETYLTVATAVVVSASITAIVLAASYVPTRRAMTIEPRQALWQD